MKNKIAALLLSLIVAFGLWVYVVTNVSPEHEQTFTGVPVVLENTNSLLDKDLMLLSGDNYTVSFTLRGSRSDLNKLNKSNLKVTMDLTTIKETGKYKMEYRISYPSGVPSVSLEEKITEYVAVEVAEYATKRVPVQLVIVGELAEDVFVDQVGVTTSVTEVTVSGPKFEVDEIDVAGIEVQAQNLTETVVGDYVYTLMDEDLNPVSVDHIQTDTAEIHMELPVAYKKDIALTVELIPGGGATLDNATVRMFDLGGDSSITIAGSREALDKIDSLQIATVKLAEVGTQHGYEDTVPLTLPENLRNLSGLSEVRFKVSLIGLDTKNFSIPKEQIQVINLPEGMQVVISTLQVNVTLRGGKNQVNAVTSDQIQLILDMQGQEVGTYSATLQIKVANVQEEHVAVYGDCSVTFTLSPIPLDEDSPPAD